MKRGRPSLRRKMKPLILETLQLAKNPLTIRVITEEVSKKFGKKISWNTTQKYLQELIKADEVQSMILPHSKIKNKNGLIVYILKK